MQLGQTGAGLSFDAISGNKKMKSILDRLLVAFPWWVDLHGWWRTNPTYNTSFSTGDPGQDFAAEAASHFGKGKGKEIPLPVDDEDHADVENDERGDMGPQNKELEPGQIPDEGEVSKDDDFPMDENNVPLTSHTADDPDWPDWDENNLSGPSSSLQLPQPQASSSNSSLVPSFQLPVSTSQHPIIPHLNINHTTCQGPTISLNSPEPDDGARKYPLPSTISSGNTRTIISQDRQIDFSSDDSDASASQMMKSLTVHSRKASGAHHSGHTSSDQDSDPLPTTSNRSVSRKRPRDMAAEFNTKLNDASDNLMRHIQDSTTAKVEHKCLKIESKLASIELKARLSRDKREHVLRSTSAAQSHERAMADERTRQLELEIKLEQVKLERLALEKEMSHQGN
ncbi:hypothetical protein EDB19DRAFT_1914346 [Suillus lakei]|nr:hypothetical protein EDB19DRAFT_1914346 [Suillus lakei]